MFDGRLVRMNMVFRIVNRPCRKLAICMLISLVLVIDVLGIVLPPTEAKQRLETMAEMETELQKLRKQLETAREEAAKKGSGLLSGIFS